MKTQTTDLVQRYKRNYNIPEEALVTEEMILRHWELEKKLTQKLLNSEPRNRQNVFADCYTMLYNDLQWLNTLSKHEKPRLEREYRKWDLVLGIPKLSIYEVGSGKADLLRFLADQGHHCKGSEISSERGQKWAKTSLIQWGTTDGVHLDKFESLNSFDALITNQVIEHLHPDDLKEHMASSYRILKRGGRYVFNTPHCYTGPHDISKIFGCVTAKGMHLKEYTYRELTQMAYDANFTNIYYAGLPAKVAQKLQTLGPNALKSFGTFYLQLMLWLENLLSWLPISLRQKVALLLHKTRLFNGNIFLVAEKL